MADTGCFHSSFLNESHYIIWPCPAVSVTVCAAVAKDKVIMWHVLSKRWNGESAAAMYMGPLKDALKKTWKHQGPFKIVEDGDRKGIQSGKGLRAKVKARISAMTLPPRSPCWMPLDYAIWDEILKIMHSTAPAGRESKAEFIKRLDSARKSLPRGFVRKSIAAMRSKIKGVRDAKGYHAKND